MALPVLMTAGATRIPIRTYVIVNFIGEIVMVGTLIGLGYFFGNVYAALEGGLRIGFIIGAVVISVALVFGFSRAMKNKIAG